MTRLFLGTNSFFGTMIEPLEADPTAPVNGEMWINGSALRFGENAGMPRRASIYQSATFYWGFDSFYGRPLTGYQYAQTPGLVMTPDVTGNGFDGSLYFSGSALVPLITPGLGVVGSGVSAAYSGLAVASGVIACPTAGMPTLSAGSSFSISAWVKIPSTGTCGGGGITNGGVFTSEGTYTGGGGEILCVSNSFVTIQKNFRFYVQQGTGHIVFSLNDQTGSSPNVSLTDSSHDYRDDTWHHVVAVKSNTSYKIYVDNVQKVSTTGTDVTPDLTNAMQFGRFIGVDSYSSGVPNFATNSYFVGLADEIGFWQVAITTANIAALFNMPTTVVDLEVQSHKSSANGYAALNSSGILPVTSGGTGQSSALSVQTSFGIAARHAVADAAYTILATDKYVALTSITATRIFTLPQASTVNPGQILIITDETGSLSQTIKLTITAHAGDTVNGIASFSLTVPRDNLRLCCDGISEWWLTNSQVDVQVFTANGTWTKPPGVQFVSVQCIGGGGGGGSGMRGLVSTIRCGGGGGGAGSIAIAHMGAAALSATETVTVGAGGTGGLAITVDSTNGSNGVAGGTSSLGTKVRALGGALGGGGSAVAGSGGAGGGGSFAGGGGTPSVTSGTPGTPTQQTVGGGGGAGGGSVTAANVVGAGGIGGAGPTMAATTALSGGTAGAASTSAGGPGGGATASTFNAGGGGGGGGANITGAGFAGGAGGIYGGGGGGGGSSLNGSSSGAGGAGAAGIVIVMSW